MKTASFYANDPVNYYKCAFWVGGVPTRDPATVEEIGGGVPFRYETDLLASKFCVPTSEAMKDQGVASFKAEFDKYFGDTGALDIFNDLVATWRVIAGSIGTAFLLRFCGSPHLGQYRSGHRWHHLCRFDAV